MAIQWKWDEKCGEAIIEQEIRGEKKEFVFNLYEGNCELIFLNEYKENGVDKYSLYCFFGDKKHMEICLGLRKDYNGQKTTNIFEDGITTFKRLRLNKKKCHKVTEITSAFIKAFDNIVIEIYKEEE